MLSEILKTVRLYHRLSTAELSREIKVSRSYLSEIETGKKAVTMRLLTKYSDNFNIPISLFILAAEKVEGKKTADGVVHKMERIVEWHESLHSNDKEQTAKSESLKGYKW